MSKWIAEFELEDGDTMPEHMDLEYKGVRIDFHCKPQEPRDDCVSRKQAIDFVNDVIGGKNDLADAIRDGVEAVLSALPPATPMRPKGRWIDHSDEGYVECPRCGSATNCDDNINDLHFCFSCGAEMEGSEGE